jgi:hypothetical protein
MVVVVVVVAELHTMGLMVMFQRRIKHATTDVPSFGSTACRYTEYETVSSKVRRNKSLIVKL